MARPEIPPTAYFKSVDLKSFFLDLLANRRPSETNAATECTL